MTNNFGMTVNCLSEMGHQACEVHKQVASEEPLEREGCSQNSGLETLLLSKNRELARFWRFKEGQRELGLAAGL